MERSSKSLEGHSLFEANPLVFKIGDGFMIKGLEIAVKTMRKNEVSLIEVKREYMRNDHGMAIPPKPINSDDIFVFQLRLLNVIPKSNENIKTSYADQNHNEKINKILDLKDKGNDYYRSGLNFQAKEAYKKALQILESCVGHRLYKEIKATLLSNLAAVCLITDEPLKVIEFCNDALMINPENIKAFYRRGMAYKMLESFAKSKQDFEYGLKLDPKNKEILKELKDLNSKTSQTFANSVPIIPLVKILKI